MTVPDFELEEITIAELQGGMEAGKFTARSLTELYLKRIEKVDKNGPAVNSVIELNPDAVDIAEQLDRERKAGKIRGPLHGIPVMIKDNIDTADKMETTAGSLALVGSKPLQDAHIVKKLREAGAVLLGKTNLSEWANFRSEKSTSGWSGRGGLTRNPYALNRNPCGSSSGSGVAVSANLCAVAIGTETDGSILCPSNANGIVGFKPTVGLWSRGGIIPISFTQDTAGPMARCVADAAALLGPLSGPDPRDAKTAPAKVKDYTRYLDENGLKDARIGVARNYFGFHDKVDEVMEEAIETIKRLGAEVIDPADIETRRDIGKPEYEVLLYEFKDGIEKYLAGRGTDCPHKTLADLIRFNEENREQEMPYFGQEIFLKALEKDGLDDRDYIENLKKCMELSRDKGIDGTLKKYKLDAIIAPSGGPAWTTDLILGDHGYGGSSTPAAVAGYPNVTVPAGFVFGLPVGLSFFSTAWSEAKLIKYAYAFEQATKHRRPPQFLKTAVL